MKLFKIKINDNLLAIFEYIRTYKHYIDVNELVKWCMDYEYYKELYENFHVIRSCLDDHNKQFPDRDLIAEYHRSTDVVIDDEEFKKFVPEDDDDLL